VARWFRPLAIVLVVVLITAVGPASAQPAPWHIAQGSDGTLYLVTGTTRYVIAPDPISDDDLAALADGGPVGSQLPMPPTPQPLVVLVPAPAQPEPAQPAQPAPAVPTPTQTSVPAPVPTNTPAPAPPTGTRDNPVQMGAVAHFVSGWDVVVVGKTPDATGIVLKENQFNSPPASGQQFFIGRVQAKYVGPASKRFDRASLTAVGSSSVAYTTFTNSCGVIPDELTENETFTGGTIVGNVCWAIRSVDAGSLLMYDSSFSARPETRMFLSLH
jgi:hypothetical protein